ncbi:gamma carbonic anhydrase family protein [Devosia rhizoryzae]|uniref:Gamma carbonic anhydrase family protein n=1 Tax=Devosia rhizoryzae TaxID=2774137 RepID=A0ABX7CD32_9HYPH|nr:gamma carbonic anhydrase family protein [Devosia rhizoryzae]QQR41204.1 gamma carbonic anhydrase family protein [Devosia rhizoryzae]
MLYSLENAAPAIDPAIAWIAPTATLIGDVIVRAQCSVWFGVVARGDNEQITIAARSNVQENVVLHTDIGFPLDIGQGCTIGHGAILHGCTIGENTLVGMGAIILNGARVGRNCLIGAGALVTEGKKIPDGSLVVGSPARVIRMLDNDAIAGLSRSAETYIRKAQRYSKHFAEVLLV